MFVSRFSVGNAYKWSIFFFILLSWTSIALVQHCRMYFYVAQWCTTFKLGVIWFSLNPPTTYLSEAWPLPEHPASKPAKYREVDIGTFHALSHTRSHWETKQQWTGTAANCVAGSTDTTGAVTDETGNTFPLARKVCEVERWMLVVLCAWWERSSHKVAEVVK